MSSASELRIEAGHIGAKIFPQMADGTNFVRLSEEIFKWLKDGSLPGRN